LPTRFFLLPVFHVISEPATFLLIFPRRMIPYFSSSNLPQGPFFPSLLVRNFSKSLLLAPDLNQGSPQDFYLFSLVPPVRLFRIAVTAARRPPPFFGCSAFCSTTAPSAMEARPPFLFPAVFFGSSPFLPSPPSHHRLLQGPLAALVRLIALVMSLPFRSPLLEQIGTLLGLHLPGCPFLAFFKALFRARSFSFSTKSPPRHSQPPQDYGKAISSPRYYFCSP